MSEYASNRWTLPDDTDHYPSTKEHLRSMDATIVTQREIVALEEIIQTLAADDRELVERFLHITSTVGELNPPPTMHRWIEKYFGSVNAVRQQKVMKITNRWTLESSLFNELRAHRPLEARIPSALAEEIARGHPDPFDDPEANTPEDVFGRVRGANAITASNIAKYDGFHGVVIFDEHDPLAFTEESVTGAVNVALAWLKEAHATDATANYPFFMWNCLWKSGASIPHGHAQMSLTKGMHYGKVEHTRRTAAQYRAQFGSDYFAATVATALPVVNTSFTASSLYSGVNSRRDLAIVNILSCEVSTPRGQGQSTWAAYFWACFFTA